MEIIIPEWCMIGAFIEWNAPHYTGVEWTRERIISYGQDGFYHKAEGCPVYYTRFNEFAKTVRPCIA